MLRRFGKLWEVEKIWEGQGRFGRLGKTWEDLGSLGKTWEVFGSWEDMGSREDLGRSLKKIWEDLGRLSEGEAIRPEIGTKLE